MHRSVRRLGAALLVMAFAWSCGASAQTAPKPKRQTAEGRQITVRKATPSYLTAGTGASIGSYNSYAVQTFNQPVPTEGTFTGMRGRERLMPDRFDGSGISLFRF